MVALCEALIHVQAVGHLCNAQHTAIVVVFACKGGRSAESNFVIGVVMRSLAERGQSLSQIHAKQRKQLQPLDKLQWNGTLLGRCNNKPESTQN